jgi:hypothetical protein
LSVAVYRGLQFAKRKLVLSAALQMTFSTVPMPTRRKVEIHILFSAQRKVERSLAFVRKFYGGMDAHHPIAECSGKRDFVCEKGSCSVALQKIQDVRELCEI